MWSLPSELHVLQPFNNLGGIENKIEGNIDKCIRRKCEKDIKQTMETVIHTHQDGCILHHSGLPEQKTSPRSKLLGLEVRPDT